MIWAHYTDSHRGFVIGFDSKHKFFDQRSSKADVIRHLRKVRHLNHRPSLVVREIDNIDDFLVKSKEWSYEKKHRILLPLDGAHNVISSDFFDIYLFKIPFLSIRIILMGAKIDGQIKDRIRKAITSNAEMKHVKLFQLSIHESKFELEKKPIHI